MNKPFFSICIPTYNRETLLPKAIDSALSQIGVDFEVVVVDNASTDNTQDVLKTFDDKRIRSFRNLSTVSMYANHNICIDFARADWIVFLHSDDQLEINALLTLRERIENHRCEVVYPFKSCHEGYISNTELFLDGRNSLPSLFRWSDSTPSGAAYQKELIKKIRFNEKIIVADWLLLADILNSDGRILIAGKNTVKIGEGVFQFSNQWHKSGAFITDASIAFQLILNYPNVKNNILSEIYHWSDPEISFLLLILCHLDEKALICKIEHELKGRILYKVDSKYRHVLLYKIFGRKGFQNILIAKNKMWG
jgi:glycosyltransferase involved in cell wall biosynthesis